MPKHKRLPSYSPRIEHKRIYTKYRAIEQYDRESTYLFLIITLVVIILPHSNTAITPSIRIRIARKRTRALLGIILQLIATPAQFIGAAAGTTVLNSVVLEAAFRGILGRVAERLAAGLSELFDAVFGRAPEELDSGFVGGFVTSEFGVGGFVLFFL